MGRFVIKHINRMKPQKKNVVKTNIINENSEVMMTTSEKIAAAQSILNDAKSNTKTIKKDKGLIERAENTKTILTEDNKELLKD